MVPSVTDFLALAGDSGAERQLAKALRAQPEEERLQFILQLLDSCDPKGFRVALRLVKGTLRERASFLRILDQGIRQADASVIDNWIEAVIEGLGFRRVVGVFAGRVEDDPEAVLKARYWLPKWLPTDNKAAVGAVRALDRALATRVQNDPRLREWFRSVRGPQGDSEPQ